MDARLMQPVATRTARSQPPRKTAQAPVRRARKVPARRAAPAPPSVGRQAGLHTTEDELDLRSAVALVVDRETDEVLFSKNPQAVLPIASITKLMTALLVVEAGLALDEELAVTPEDVRATARSNSRRRLAPGTTLTRGEMLHLALMASENRAAQVLGRTYPGGLEAFIEAMNARAALLGMSDTRFVEPTGLSSDNRSSARDLARLVRAASEHPLIREYSTASDTVVETGRRQVQFRNTNGLVHNPEWDIAVQKTGYIAAAGRCLVLQAQMAGRQLIMVLLDSAGRYSRIGDAERLRRWLFASTGLARANAAPATATARTLADDGEAGDASDEGDEGDDGDSGAAGRDEGRPEGASAQPR
ncbi:MAG: D-alanyl-D-alanine endopeptidase [Rubrivivax sp.]|nr:D-alanyl-D-alanine endopeptidase [Rubrivivax sp.]